MQRGPRLSGSKAKVVFFHGISDTKVEPSRCVSNIESVADRTLRCHIPPTDEAHRSHTHPLPTFQTVHPASLHPATPLLSHSQTRPPAHLSTHRC